MLRNQQQLRPSTTQPSSGGTTTPTRGNNVEELILHLCHKIASVNNLSEKARDEFINRSYSTMIKLFCSITYRPVYDSFEISQKIKNKRKRKLNFHMFRFVKLLK